MGVILDVNWVYWDKATQAKTVGWPYASPFAYQRIAADAAEYAAAGFTVVNFPPSCECGGGTESDGYDLKDNYSFDNTAFGTREMLQQAVAVAHANGLQVYGDLVLHQYGGYPNGTYPTLRFPKHPTCFSQESTVGGVPTDPVPNTEGNYSFGDMACYFTSLPGGYMYFGAIAAAQWQTASLGFDGYRVDDVKGTYVGIVKGILDAPVISDLFAFGEYFDGNPSAVSYWVNYDMDRRASVLDFAFKFNVSGICNNNSTSWMGALANIGWCTTDAFTAVTFLESADTDTTVGEQLVWNKILGYAIMLTFPGYPRVYYRDWSTDENCYGLKPLINNLIWIHENLAQGDFVPLIDDDPQVFVHARLGYGDAPGCIAAFNNDQWHAHAVTVPTYFGSNQRVHEYTGLGGYYDDLWTDGEGRLTFTIPRNDNGLSYLVFGLPGVEGEGFERAARETTQVIYGAADLNIPAATNGTLTITPRLYAAAGTQMTLLLAPDMTEWGNDVELALVVAGPSGSTVAMLAFDDQSDAGTAQELNIPKAPATGFYTLSLVGTNLPPAGCAFSITATYTAPKGV